MPDSINLDLDQHVLSEADVLYRNLQQLGEGGNATTYLTVATSGPHRGVLFAIKIFRELSKPDRRESFIKEIDFLQRSDHPSVMRVFDSGVFDAKHPFLVAEYLPNTLHQVMKSKKKLRMVEKTSFALQLLSALTYLENQDPPVVHRDIKPKNIFVKGRSCVLGDFGLIKRVDAGDDEDRDILKESLGVGMPYHYRTPDLVSYLNGEAPPTTSSDVFQLGLVLAELFTGQNPQKETAAFADPVELEPLGAIPGRLSSPIAGIINRMLELNPQSRESVSRFHDMWGGIFASAVKQARVRNKRRAIW
ncbi:MAG: serine/threonine protein kinase [Planctomycetes bacterium]|nr:serine/threonine protein kinase [Planctomycetota bacterium]